MYYGSDSPEISDSDYDKLLKRLEYLEDSFPELKATESPAATVGAGDLVEGFSKRQHLYPLLSLEKAYSIEELSSWEIRLKKLTDQDSSISYVCEAKLDGLSMALTYENGLFISAVTRGNGRVGEDVTANMKMVEGVPLKLSESISIIVRGEVVMPRSEFARLNEIAEEEGSKLFANPRNAAAGTIRQLSSAIVAERKLQIICYDILGRHEGSHWENLLYLKKLGFITSDFSEKADSIESIRSYIDALGEKRSSLEIDIDGVVIKVDDLATREIAGYTHRAPRWAVSFKYQAERMETTLKNVIFQVGRTGVITPVAELEPIELSGSVVSRASLHNFDDLQRKKIRIGVKVLVEKAGEIIPQIVEVSGPAEDGTMGVEVSVPTHCPSCESELTRREGEVALRCLNYSCPVQVVRRLEHFLSKGAINADGFGPSVVSQLVSLNLVSSYGSLYQLTVEDFMKLSETKEKLAQKLWDSLQARRSVPLDRFIMGLGINFVGTRTASLLSEHFETMENLIAATEEELVAIDGIGDKTAQAIASFFAIDGNKAELASLLDSGFTAIAEVPVEVVQSPLSGKSVVVTGSFMRFGRKEAEELLKKMGARCGTSVSKKTDYVVAGDKAGSKLSKAQSLGVEILNEEQLYALFDQYL
jgi:DNA ligase (NAD+)